VSRKESLQKNPETPGLNVNYEKKKPERIVLRRQAFFRKRERAKGGKGKFLEGREGLTPCARRK